MAGFGQVAATLTVHRGPGAGRSFSIEAPAITIGRHGQCDLQVNDTWVSRQHARITWGGAGYLLEDLDTVNGTYVNGERISGPRALRSGDVLQLGTQVELGFQVGAPAAHPGTPAIPEVAPIPERQPAPESRLASQSRPAPPPAFPEAAPMPESKPAPAPAFSEAAPSPESKPAPQSRLAPESRLAPPPAETADTEMQEAQKAASGALTSAIVGLIICGLILAPSAIVQARKARKVLRSGDPGYGKAIAAEIIGWIGLALWVLALIYRFSDM
jgi:pSer/pThr/pTyr-binding forkhead associated (FHA) protein